MCLDCFQIEAFIHEMQSWPRVTGEEVEESAKAADVRSYTRPVDGSKRGLSESVSETLDDLEARDVRNEWKQKVNRRSLSHEGRGLTAEYYTSL